MRFAITTTVRIETETYEEFEERHAEIDRILGDIQGQIPDDDGGYLDTTIEGLDEESRAALSENWST